MRVSKAWDRYGNTRGFTLVELLVAIAVLGVLIGLCARPVHELLVSVSKAREESAAAIQNLAFLNALSQDVRCSIGIAEATSGRIVLAGGVGGETVVWQIGGEAATRTVGSAATTPFPLRVTSLLVAPRETSVPIRYLLVRGTFEGLGSIERGMAVRVGDSKP